MSLKDLKPLEAEVKTSGGSFSVRGLSLEDIASLVTRHRAAAEAMFQQFSGQPDQALNDARAIGVGLLQVAPAAVAEIIAIASGDADEEGVAIAKRLPIDVQLAALEKIGEMTFATEGGLKNALSAVVRMLSNSTEALKSLRA